MWGGGGWQVLGGIGFNAVTSLKVDSIMGNFSQCRLCPFNQRARYPLVLREMINRLYFQIISFLSKMFWTKKIYINYN
jgi:hypothetical protein